MVILTIYVLRESKQCEMLLDEFGEISENDAQHKIYIYIY